MTYKPPLHSSLWFDPQSLQALADAGAWSRGLMLYRSQKVLSIDIEPFKGHWLLLGEVQGTRRTPYELSIELTLKPDGRVSDWESDCECPVGQQCKHGVALMLKAAYKGLQLLSSEADSSISSPISPTPPSPEQVEAKRLAALARAQAQAQLDAEVQLLSWLRQLERAGGAQPPAQDPARPAERQNHYLYLLSIIGAQGPSPELQLETVVAYPKVNGGWSKPKPIRTPPCPGQSVFDCASTADHDLLQLLRAMPGGTSYFSGLTFKSRVSLQGQVGQMALQQAAATGRLFLDDGLGSPSTTAVQWGPPLQPRWEWREVNSPKSAESNWSLRGKLEGSAKLCLNQPPLYLDATQGLCGPVLADGLSAAQLGVLLKAPALKPAALQKHQTALMERLGTLPLPPLLQQLTKLAGITPLACLHLSLNAPERVRSFGLIQAQLRYDYAGHRGWWTGQGTSVVIEGAKERFLLQRDVETELDAVTSLLDLNLRSDGSGNYGLPGDADQQAWLAWADNGFAVFHEAGFTLTLDDALQGWVTHADTLEVALRPQGGQGDEETTSPWFDLSLGMEINGQRHNILPWLPDLIAAAANSPLDPETGLPDIPPFVYLPSQNGSGFIRLPTDTLKPWMSALLELVGDRSHDFTGESLKLARLDALRVGAALGEGAVWAGAQALRDMVQGLSGQSELPTVPVPASVQASLRPYQQQGLNWLQFLRQHGLGGILADDRAWAKPCKR